MNAEQIVALILGIGLIILAAAIFGVSKVYLTGYRDGMSDALNRTPENQP